MTSYTLFISFCQFFILIWSWSINSIMLNECFINKCFRLNYIQMISKFSYYWFENPYNQTFCHKYLREIHTRCGTVIHSFEGDRFLYSLLHTYQADTLQIDEIHLKCILYSLLINYHGKKLQIPIKHLPTHDPSNLSL